MQSVDMLLVMIAIAVIMIPLLVSLWIYNDAKKRKYEHPYVVAIFALFFTIITLIAWLVFRPKLKKKVKK